MIGGVIITHSPLADSLVEAAGSIAGRIENLKTISVKRDDSTERIRKELTASIKEVNTGDGVIIFTDMFGGTPTNIALSLLKEDIVEIITGVNIPMILKFVSYRSEKKLHELAIILKEHAQESIVLVSDMLKIKK